jgi:hypothetical protein
MVSARLLLQNLLAPLPLPVQICRSCPQPPAPAPNLPANDGRPLPRRWPGFANSVLDCRKRTRSRPGASRRSGFATNCSPCTRPPIIIMEAVARRSGARPAPGIRASWSGPIHHASLCRRTWDPVGGWGCGWTEMSTGPSSPTSWATRTGWWLRSGFGRPWLLVGKELDDATGDAGSSGDS